MGCKTADPAPTATRAVTLWDALRQRGISTVNKGDQNQLWDGALTDVALACALEPERESGIRFRPFVHDEKLGTPDIRLCCLVDPAERPYLLTEDYYGRRSGAVWVTQDVSYGLFYTEPVSAEAFSAYGVDLPWLAAQWRRFRAELRQDSALRAALIALGLPLAISDSSRATGLGPVPEPEVLHTFFEQDPVGELYYLLTRSCGLYGIVPSLDRDESMSAVRADDPAVRRLATRLLVEFAVMGALRSTPDAQERRAIIQRARALVTAASSLLGDSPLSFADAQAELGGFLAARCAGSTSEPPYRLTRTSEFMMLAPEVIAQLGEPAVPPLVFFDLALRYPAEFAWAYNEALRRARLGLQRASYDPARGLFAPPFYVERWEVDASGKPTLPRYQIELLEHGRRVRLFRAGAPALEYTSEEPIRSAAAFLRLLAQQPGFERGVAIVGKAGPFAAEASLPPSALALPRQGSRYSPFVGHFIRALHEQGISLDGCLILRVGVNALDNLAVLGDRPIRLPPHLAAFFCPDRPDRCTTCADVAAQWRRIVARCEHLLGGLAALERGEFVHLMKLVALPPVQPQSDPKLQRFLERVEERLPGAAARLHQFAESLPGDVRRYVAVLVNERERVLAARRQAPVVQELREVREVRDRWRIKALLMQRRTALAALDEWQDALELRLQLILAAQIRRLVQVTESLPYLNDRPYTLALYLMFGEELLQTLVQRAEFDIEPAGQP